VIGAVTHARLKPGTADAERSVKLAKIVAGYMLGIRFKEGTPWAYFVPTYYGPHSEKATKDHLKPINSFSIMGVDAGHAFLDLYDYSGEARYLEAAKKIADTYLSRQLDNGSWYQFVNHETGEPTAENIVIPTSVINYFDRLKTGYGVKGLEKSSAKALTWIMENPVKTFDWQGQFEDIYVRPPYHNLSREQACDLAVYLFRNKKNRKLAEELVRFSEDQFVIWEQPMKIAYQKPRPGGNSENWITPSVQEQYVFWMPVGRAAGIMLETFWEAYAATKQEIYLAKAKSIANAFTVVQKAHDGDYPTFFTQYPMNRWLNSTVYPGTVMMRLQENINKL
jgi:maltose/maltodextrin transport system substrate-binding protein